MKKALAVFALISHGWLTAAWAQTPTTPPASTDVNAVAASAVLPSPVLAPAPAAATRGIQGQNIFEVRPAASEDPGFMEQTNGERARVQPGNNAPMWRQVSGGITGFSSLPRSEAPEAGNLIQGFVKYPGSLYTTAGEAWRQTRNQWIIPYGGSLILITLLALALFYFAKGPVKLDGAPTGRLIERFTYFERAAHWVNAIAFSILALSGIVMAFGKFFLLPVMGGALFGWLTWVLKTAHNFVGPMFVVSLVVVFFTFLRDNWPVVADLTWLRKGGGLLSGEHVPSARFNAGEKIVFWAGVFGLGLVVAVSGLVLDKVLPGFEYVRATMQVAHMVHAVATVLMICMFMGHIYLGTIGTEGALDAMKTGYVDETWARQHHELWYDDIAAGKIPAQRSHPAGEAGGTPSTPDVRPVQA